MVLLYRSQTREKGFCLERVREIEGVLNKSAKRIRFRSHAAGGAGAWPTVGGHAEPRKARFPALCLPRVSGFLKNAQKRKMKIPVRLS
jgi:hypothetical protein